MMGVSPIADQTQARVVPFRPRRTPRVAGVGPPGSTSPSADEPDDYRRRMLANAAAFAATAALTAGGIWLAVTLADLRRTQDCVLTGRRDCARLHSPQDRVMLTYPSRFVAEFRTTPAASARH
jgi:hypothetical protein